MQQGLLENLLWFINEEEGGIIHPHTQRRFFFPKSKQTSVQVSVLQH